MKTFIQVALIFTVMTLVLLLTACFEEFDDGYQFGDVTKMTVREVVKLEKARQQYCNIANGSAIRAAALAYIRSQIPLIPKNGICGEDPNYQDLKISAYDGMSEYIRDGPEPPNIAP